MTTSTQLLTAVNTAIMQALAAQAYTVHGRSKQMAALRDLMKARTELMDEVDAEASGSMVSLLSLEQPTA